jgi:undecaprenyl-diphosphatase
MNIFSAIFQAIIQGFTEFLPVSSSGHLSLIQHFTGVVGEEALVFSIILHLGTLVAIFFAFKKLIIDLFFEFFRAIFDIFTGKFSFKDMTPPRRMLVMLALSLACFIIYIPFKDFAEGVVGDGDIIIEGICFLITATMLFIADRAIKGKKTAKDIKAKDAITIGLFQGVALMPGVSRSGSTIAGALIAGLSRETAVEYSFLLGVPSILAGSIFALKDVDYSNVDIGILPAVLGFLISAIVGVLAIKLVKWLVTSDRFMIFSYYTLILGVLVIIAGIYEKIAGQNILQAIF